MSASLGFLDADAIGRAQADVADQVMSAARRGVVAIVGSAALPQKCAAALAAAGGSVDCFIEWDPRFWGREVAGRPVVSADQAFARLGAEGLAIVGVWSPNHRYGATEEWLRHHGFAHVLPVAAVFWALDESISPHYQLSAPGLFGSARERAETLMLALDDAESRLQLERHLRWRVTLRSEHIPLADRAHVYFDPRLFRLPDDAVVVDVGAFDGDSLRSFLHWKGSRFQRFYALEPDPVSFRRLQEYLIRLPPDVSTRVEAMQMAAGDRPGMIRVAGTGAPGSGGQGPATEGEEVPVARLADAFADEKIDYLKFDIEGAEAMALEGVWPLLDHNRPVIGVAVYHKPLDIFDLPLKLVEKTRDYRFYLRSHDEDGIDLVFYAVPEELTVLREGHRA